MIAGGISSVPISGEAIAAANAVRASARRRYLEIPSDVQAKVTPFKFFEVVEVKSQVVAGQVFYLKVQITPPVDFSWFISWFSPQPAVDEFIQLRVFRPLDGPHVLEGFAKGAPAAGPLKTDLPTDVVPVTPPTVGGAVSVPIGPHVVKAADAVRASVRAAHAGLPPGVKAKLPPFPYWVVVEAKAQVVAGTVYFLLVQVSKPPVRGPAPPGTGGFFPTSPELVLIRVYADLGGVFALEGLVTKAHTCEYIAKGAGVVQVGGGGGGGGGQALVGTFELETWSFGGSGVLASLEEGRDPAYPKLVPLLARLPFASGELKLGKTLKEMGGWGGILFTDAPSYTVRWSGKELRVTGRDGSPGDGAELTKTFEQLRALAVGLQRSKMVRKGQAVADKVRDTVDGGDAPRIAQPPMWLTA